MSNCRGRGGKTTYLGEERVETVNLLPLFDIGVVLGDTAEGELVHQIDLVWGTHVLVLATRQTQFYCKKETTHLEVLDNHRESGAEKHNLSLLRQERQQLLHHRCKLGREELVGFVHHEHWAFTEIRDTLASQIQYPSRRSDKNVHRIA
mgnify:CR=1 FL=1